ncbi:MAG: hypothetical protein E6940_01030 [Clostridium septicum]|uniref:Uncharacterized protein n=2 Tax=Clostridium septicum TaxID=1504 RepID=A0A9N7JN93_CLOSE|nr:hypothetical protein [Clostridium septicum]AYE35045.1 hypothetical protein CP523_11820 [Clostridium septicum]MDU1312634.1 hypothetical protein [Clostridium septicum]
MRLMYFYFLLIFNITLIVAGLLGSILTLSMLLRKRINKGYYLLVLLLVYCSISVFKYHVIPMVKDLTIIKNDSYKTFNGTCENISIGVNRTISIDGKRFYYNSWNFTPKPKENYHIYYMPNSNFIIDLEKNNKI